MINTDKYESMRRLFLDFIESASDEVDEEAWRNKLTMLDELLAEVKRLYEMMDVLASFDIVKNVEQGFTQREWVELVELVKRGD